jgi:hypothetical protein
MRQQFVHRGPMTRTRRTVRFAALACAAGALFATQPASAAGTSIKAALVETSAIKLDGIPKEWPALMALTSTVKGAPSKADLQAQAAISYDSSNIFIAADVTDDALRGGGDRISVVIGFPGGAVHEVELFPGEPGKSAASAKTKDGKAIAGAKVIEAPRSGGWTLEASIPWSAFPPATTTRVGLRGAIFAHDADASTTIEASVGTAPSASYDSLPPVSIESEQALGESLKAKKIRNVPRFNLIADVAGDALKERVIVFDQVLVVLGPTFRKGAEFFWTDLGVDASAGMLPSCETRDLTGDGQAEIILRKRLGKPKSYREYMQVLQFGKSDTPTMLFQTEVAVVTEKGSVENDVRFDPDGAKMAITITPGKAKNFDAGNYAEPRETSMDPALLPWETIASRTYKWNGKGFVKSGEEKQAGTSAPVITKSTTGPAVQAQAPRPAGPSMGELLDRVYGQYKRDRGVTGKARFSLNADVTGDSGAESVLLHDRDLVVFGNGWKSGTGFTYLSLGQFAKGSDISEISTQDLTGDGKAEILIKGTIHGANSSDGPLGRDVLLVYQMVDGEGLKRVFAVETARSQGRKRIEGTVKFVKAARGMDIEVSSGKAIEWNAGTYPFTQDMSPVGGVEPLILPWSNLPPARYRWKAGGFSK